LRSDSGDASAAIFELFLRVLLQHAEVAAAQSPPPSIVLTTTTSLDNSGLLAKILPVFTRETGITVNVLALGTGRALRTAARECQVDLGLVLDTLNQELEITRLLLEGGGNANGSFLRAALVDEISLAIFPAVDGTKGAPCVFDSSDEEAGMPAPIRAMTLERSRCWRAVWSGSAVASRTLEMPLQA
jgi:riboflavin biosynthesis pyrimidine reductase